MKVESGIFNSNSVEDTDSLIKKAEKKELLQVLVKADQVVTENLPYSKRPTRIYVVFDSGGGRSL